MDAKDRADYSAEQQVKPRRSRPKSFVLKITLAQAMRMLRLIITIDILVIVAFLALMFIELEYKVTSLAEMEPEAAAQAALLVPGLTVSDDAPAGEGMLLGEWSQWPLDTLGGSVRRIDFIPYPEAPFLPFWQVRPIYTVWAPQNDGQYFQATFDIGAQVGRLWNILLVIFCIQGLMLITNTAAARRSVRRTLAPIQQLAVATRNISTASVGQSVEKDWQSGGHVLEKYRKAGRETANSLGKLVEPGQVKARGRKRARTGYGKEYRQPEELKLSGTIDTLNKITAKHLDARIPVEQERQELRGLASAVNSMLDRLDAAYSSQLRFVSDASHELRTPIAVLQGYANMLDRWGKEDPAVLQESIEAIKAEAEGMKVLVEQLLFLARGDNNTIALQVHPLDVCDYASDVLRETQLIDKGHDFVSDFQGGAQWVEGDVSLLKQALRVFVDNAVKYSPAGGRIKIGVSTADGWTRVSVTDNGIGIPEKDLPHVFERFYRSDESRARATGGTGLGLSIAKWIVERHGGYLEILSREEIGTRLTMVLPAVEEPPAEEPDDDADTANVV